jgi:hypothetical protein
VGPTRERGAGRCLEHAFESKQTIRAVIAKASDTAAVDGGADASKIKKTFSVKQDWYGKVVEFDGRNVTTNFAGHSLDVDPRSA